MTVPTPRANLLPPRPRLVLRVGFAGVRDLPTDMMEPLTEVLVSVFETIARQLVEIAPGQPTRPGQPPRISRFYSQEAPLLRLITGLAEGSDAFALGALDLVAAGPAPVSGFAAELAAVLPFDVAVYRGSRNEAFRPEFDRQAARCAYILTLDGLYDKPRPDTKLAQRRRAGAYRAQSTFLLRQSDLFLVVANPDVPGKPGGTTETVHAALAFDLPVIFIHAGTGEVRLIDPGQDLGSALGIEAPDKSEWQATLRGWVTNVATGSSTLAVPQIYAADERVRGGAHSHGRRLLEEFLADAELPPMVVGPDGRPQRKTTFRERRWLALETRFRPRGLSGARRPVAQPLLYLSLRASALNRHYSGLYRGAFVQNYRLAVYAVTLATLSLALLATAHVGTTATARAASGRRAVKIDVMSAIVAPASAPPSQIAEPKVSPTHEALSLPQWLVPAIFGLGLVKLVILVWIFQNTREANDGDWNDKAVDYRYLAERLRTMFYLPRIGSFQPPAAAKPQYVARAARQSAVDWLLDAIVRSISPAELPVARKIPTTLAADGTQCEVTIIRLDPPGLLADLRDRWVDEQALYHDRTAHHGPDVPFCGKRREQAVEDRHGSGRCRPHFHCRGETALRS